jgi:ribosomal protein L21
MFNLDVATEKLEKFKDLLDEANVTSRVLETKEEGSVTILKFKNQEELERAIVLKTML